MVASLRCVVAVEHDCSVAVESLLENGENGIRLETSGQRGYDCWANAAAHERDRQDDRRLDRSIFII